MKAPTVSIGMPVFNGQMYVAQAIESILHQTFSDFELIISDNASKDSTAEICEQYAQKDDRIKFVRQETNLGVFNNFANVLDRARGTYFMWAGCDDIRSPDYLESCIDVFRSDPACVSVFSGYRVINLDTNEEICLVTPSSSASEFAFCRLFVRIVDLSPALIYGLHQTDVIKEIGVESYDWYDVFVSLALAAKGRLHVIPRPLYMPGSKHGGVPYSVTGSKISLWDFYFKAVKLLFYCNGLTFVERLTLCFCLTSKCARATVVFNRLYKSLLSDSASRAKSA